MNFSFTQKGILVRKLLQFGLNKKLKFWSGFRHRNVQLIFDNQWTST